METKLKRLADQYGEKYDSVVRLAYDYCQHIKQNYTVQKQQSNRGFSGENFILQSK